MKRHVISRPPVFGSSRRAVVVWMSVLAVVLSVLLVASWELPGVPASSVVQCRAVAAGPDGNGEAVIRAGAALDIAADGIVIGLAVALQETGLRNLANPSVPETLSLPHDGLAADHRAVGILALDEQWGTAVELMSPDVAARKWFTAMRGIEGWQAMVPQQVASAVMHSALPDTYAGRLGEARRFYERHREASAAMCDAQGRW